MKLFLTGGTGFIGSHLLALALSEGHQVYALRRTPQTKSVISLPCEPHWITGNFQTLRLEQMVGVDAVVHLGSAGVSPKRASWAELLDVNVIGSLKLYQLGLEAGISRYVVSGTCYEYGNSASRNTLIPPNAPLEPISPYAASKAAGYHVARAFAIDHKLELFYGRIFTAYGEGQYRKNFWPSLRKAALDNEDFPMTSGRNVYDFVPVGYVVRCLLDACLRPDLVKGSPLVVNIGTGKSSTLLDFAQKQWELFNAKGSLLPGLLPDRTNHVEHYAADITGLNA